mgnify:FL=1
MAQRITRRAFFGTVAAATAATVVSACRPTLTPTGQPPATKAPVATQPAVEPTKPAATAAPTAVPTAKPAPTVALAGQKVEFWGVESAQGNEQLLALLKEMQAKTGLTIEFVRAPGGWPSQLDRLAAAIAAGSGPDIAHIKDFNMWDYAWRGALLPLDEYYAKDNVDTKVFRKSIWEAMHYQGKAYGAPWKGSFVWGLFLNDTLFQQAGLDPVKDAPAKWPQVVEVAKKLTDESAKRYGYGFYDLGITEPNFMLFSAYVGQAGGKVISADKTKLTLDTPEANEAMQWMYDLLWTHKVAVPPAMMASLSDMTLAGSVGMWITGFWSPAGYDANAPQLKYSTRPMHCYKTCDNVDTPECMVVLKGAKRPVLSWEAIKLLLDPKIDLERSWVTGWLPA